MSKTRVIAALRQLDLDTVRELLDARPELLAVTDRQGRNLLHLACSVPDADATDLVSLLLDRGIGVDSTVALGEDVVDAVWFAVARARNPALVRLLVERGGTANGLFAAGWYEDIPMIDLLVELGAEVDVVAGVTPFLFLWHNRKFEAVRRLVRHGADVNHQDDKGRTALHRGVEKGYDPDLLRFLVLHGADPDVPDHDGLTSRAMAARKRDKRYAEALS